ncbi:MAG TPA: cytochrome P450 [Nocardioides sp.]
MLKVVQERVGKSPAGDVGRGAYRHAQATVRRALMWAVSRRGIDLSQLDKVPDSLAWPLKRDGMDPPARLAEVRASEPIHLLTTFMGMKVWLVTGHELAREVLGDVASYSSDIRPYVGKSGASDGDIGGLGFTDPPEHTRLRKLLTPEFTMRRLDRIRPMVSRIVDQQLDEIARLGESGEPVDLVPTFAFAVPFLVICELLGLPDDRRDTFRSLGAARFDVTNGGMGSLGAISGSREFLLAEAARQRTDPGPGLIGQIVRETGDDINDYDLGGLADGVFTGGMETSAGMLALGTAVLLGHPEWWEKVRDDDESVGPVVEELLRYLSVVQVAFPRFAKTDVQVGDAAVRKGDVVLASLPAASRDDVFGDNPEAFDPSRPARPHLAFGHGLHRCVGAELARMELRAAYPALARRFPEMKLAEQEIPFTQSSIVYGVESLLVWPGPDASARAR